MATYLDHILVAHRDRAARDDRPLAPLVDAAKAMPRARRFRAALVDYAGRDGIAVIAEVKRRSPSKGALAMNLDPKVLARAYAAGGAACLSVLTDDEFFGGSADDLARARASGARPVLRKDFTVDLRDVCDARIMGADCVLLIAAALDDEELLDFHQLACEVGLDVLVEIHDEAELDRALKVEPDLIGVNQRDLFTFEVDQARAMRLAPLMPEGVVRVAESGIRSGEDAAALAAAGYHALLVGETLVKAGDPAAAVKSLRVAARDQR